MDLENKTQQTHHFTILVSPLPSLFPDMKLARWKETLGTAGTSLQRLPLKPHSSPVALALIGLGKHRYPGNAWYVALHSLPLTQKGINAQKLAWAFPY